MIISSGNAGAYPTRHLALHFTASKFCTSNGMENLADISEPQVTPNEQEDQ